MKYYTEKPKIEWIDPTENGDTFKTVNAMRYHWKEKTLIVPAGFASDGASVPPFLWMSVSPKVDARTIAGAIAHDYIYRNAPEGWTRKEADSMFYDIIRADGLSWWKAQKAYWGVRLFGASSWRGE